MKLKIHPSKNNHYPLGGFLIKGDSVRLWLLELQSLSFKLSEIRIYIIPDVKANSIWGCLVIPHQLLTIEDVGKYELCQVVYPNFFIPEKSIFSPFITDKESKILFAKGLYFFHPEIGFALLEKLNLKDIITSLKPLDKAILQPELPVFVPKEIRQFQIIPLDDEDISHRLSENIFVKSEKIVDEPLDIIDKAKLSIYDKIFDKDADEKGQKSNLMKSLDNILGKVGFNSIFDEMLIDFDDLQERNKNELEKLMKLLKDNPDEALKYAIPLDETGVSRGGTTSEGFTLSKRWFDFSLFGNSNSKGQGAGANIKMDDEFEKLQRQYHQTAQDFIYKKEYEKAAFIYMKLLKDYYLAAQTLENGKLYQEAAIVYLKHAKDKSKAAECYEKGNMIQKAIDLYIELKSYEKVGDLNILIQNTEMANEYYEKAIFQLKGLHKYERAALIYASKIKNKTKSQSTLLEGWDAIQRTNLLNLYFENIVDARELKKAYNLVYMQNVSDKNRIVFLNVVKKEYNKQNEHKNDLKDMAYDIIAKEARKNRSIVYELKYFNIDDKAILRDIGRF